MSHSKIIVIVIDNDRDTVVVLTDFLQIKCIQVVGGMTGQR